MKSRQEEISNLVLSMRSWISRCVHLLPFPFPLSYVEIGTIYEGKRHVAKECGNGGGFSFVHLVEFCGEWDG